MDRSRRQAEDRYSQLVPIYRRRLLAQTAHPSQHKPSQLPTSAVRGRASEVCAAVFGYRTVSDRPFPDAVYKIGRRNLERHAAQHRRAADLEAATLIDQSVRGPLPYHAAVFEVVDECRLRCIRRYASHISHGDLADRIPESLVRPASTRVVGLVGGRHPWPRCVSVARH